MVNDLLLYWIHHGRISVVPGLDRFEDRTVHFIDGTSREFDTIIWATGFHPTVPFLDPALVRTRGGVPLRTAGGVVPAGLDRLYLIGMAAPRGPQIMLYPIQARLALAMVQLWEDGWDASLAAAFEAEQPLDDRIDMIRPDWEAQMSQARELLLAWTGQVRTRASALVS